MIKQPTAIICLSHNSGGMEIDSIKLAKKLSSEVPITLIAQADCFIANSKEDYMGYNGIVLETVSFYSSLSLSIIFNVRKIVKEKGIKNVIFFGASELKSLYFSFLGLDINLIVRHGTTKSRPKKDWFHRLIYSNVNTHVSICKHLQKNVETIIPFGKNSQSVIIYSSLELPNIEKKAHDKLSLLHVGRIAEGKGQADAIQACQILYDKGIDFIFYLVGGFDVRYEQTFMEQYEALPYKEKIVLVGFTKNVGEYYVKSDIFLFPSYGEGLSNAFLEALANELICISYANTSFPELQELGTHIHLCNDRDIDSLKRTLLSTVKNLPYEKIEAVKNYDFTKHYFSIDREIKDYLYILK
jgi:glycosyltransferase involved in cell wall biosynthesis